MLSPICIYVKACIHRYVTNVNNSQLVHVIFCVLDNPLLQGSTLTIYAASCHQGQIKYVNVSK